MLCLQSLLDCNSCSYMPLHYAGSRQGHGGGIRGNGTQTLDPQEQQEDQLVPGAAALQPAANVGATAGAAQGGQTTHPVLLETVLVFHTIRSPLM